MALSDSQAQKIIKSLGIGDTVEMNYLGKEKKGKIISTDTIISNNPTAKMKGGLGLTDVISVYGLRNNIKSFTINGKKIL